MTGPTIAAAVYGFFEAAYKWLGALPNQNLADVLQGALLLVRRTFFNQAPQANSVQVFNYSEVLAGGDLNDLPTAGSTQHPSAQLVATDPELDGMEWSADSSTFTTVSGGHVVLNSDGSFLYTPAVGFNGTDQFTASVTDTGPKVNLVDLGRPSGTTVTVQVTVNQVEAAADYFNELAFNNLLYFTGEKLPKGGLRLTMVNSSGQPAPPDLAIVLSIYWGPVGNPLDLNPSQPNCEYRASAVACSVLVQAMVDGYELSLSEIFVDLTATFPVYPEFNAATVPWCFQNGGCSSPPA